MRKILFNRDEPSAHEIKGKQDFDLVIKKYKENEMAKIAPAQFSEEKRTPI